MSFVIPQDDLALTDRAKVGGKAAQLARLIELGEPVPAFVVLGTDAFSRYVSHNGLSETLARLDDAQDLEVHAAALKERLTSGELPADLSRELTSAYRALIADAPHGRVALRSSGVIEDDTDASCAGMFETALFLEDEAAVLRAARELWSAAFSPRLLAYIGERGVKVERFSVALVLQRMLSPEAAGVAFSADPTSGERDIVIVSAGLGCGEGVVQGLVDADTFRVQADGRVEANVADKREAVTAKPGGGTMLWAVPETQRRTPALDEPTLRDLAARVRRVALAQGAPQDIEWALEQGRLYLLQTRPITALPPPPPSGARRLWDNSNIVESYPGVTTPLTYTFAKRAYTVVYEQFCEVMGVPGDVIRDNREIFSQMIGLYRGRIYYNLQSWYRLISLLPGYDANREFMEQMMGVSEAASLAGERDEPSLGQKLLVEAPRTARMVARLLERLARVQRDVDAFQTHFDRVFEEVRRRPLEELSLEELEATVGLLETELLQRWRAPIITDFYAMVFYGVLKKLCASWLHDEGATLQNDLLSGIGDLASAEPARRLMAIAARVRADGELLAAFERLGDRELLEPIRQDGPLSALAPLVDAYLDELGDRCMEELKLETIPLRDDPSFLFASIRGFLSRPDLTPETVGVRERLARERAEAEARRRLADPARRFVFDAVLTQARRHIRNRESLRLSRSKVFGVARRIYLAAGARLCERGALAEPRDVLWLHCDEVWDFARGTAVTGDLDALVSLRRAEFGRYAKEPAPPARFVSQGPPPLFLPARRAAAAPAGGLRGLGACPGVVEGRARVIREPAGARLEPGEVLVAERTDPGWVPLFVSAHGLLVERGSMLSHSAIVAREFGVPTVVGIAGLLDQLRTGDLVRFDGTTGHIEVLERAAQGDDTAEPGRAA